MKLETLGCVWVIVLALWFWVEVIKFGRISLDCRGCSGFFRSHWRSLYRFWGHRRAKKAMPQLAAALLFGRWPMHRYDHFLSTHIDSNTLVIAQWVKIIGDGLFVCSGGRVEEVSLGEGCLGQSVRWYALLASIHWRSYRAGNLMSSSFYFQGIHL